ncbi:MAG: DUF2294 domain-containing protein [Cyanobacteria bacterium J06631_2]
MSIENPESYPTAGQLERIISQKVRALYRQQLGHQPTRVDCHLLGNKLVISLENVVTPLEKLLAEAQSSILIDQVRAFINQTMKPLLQKLVEEISQVNVVNCLYDTAIETGYAGAILVFANPPQVRRSKSSLKRSQQQSSRLG